ncbi:MAG: low-specificity L-threonine aldolase [Anaerolineae bacterium]|nr:low-specificity L-threonine aldolase [Anaerolineae bacterium]
MHIIDLRSDTITKPTPAMRAAMAAAEVGDDVFREDPTVIRLEEMAAERLGKEAALFVASGTMGNLVSLLAQCGRGDEVIVGDQAHTYIYEQGGMAALGGIHPRVARNLPDGTLDLDEVRSLIRGDNVHFPRTRLIAIENTHNRCGGSPLTVAYMQAIGRLAHERGLLLHVDGARIFNAAVALGVDVKALAADADSVTFCLSKGLAAPVGSVVCGSRTFIAEARRARKVVGGGMRQAGVIAAAGIVALEQMVDRLAEDHANAAALAAGLAELPGIEVEPVPVRTNIVFFRVNRPDLDAPAFTGRLEAAGVRMLALDPRRVRAVTNYHVTAEDVQTALGVMREILS